jgi:hypothetical protein
MNQVEQLLCFSLGHDEFDFYCERSGKLEELRFTKFVMPSKSGHCAKRGAAANAELICLFEQPLPGWASLMPLTFMYV